VAKPSTGWYIHIYTRSLVRVKSGYTSEAPVHWVPQDYPSLLVHFPVLLLYVLGSILHALSGKDTLLNQLLGSEDNFAWSIMRIL
jgi:hypothetical protein